MAKSNVNNPQVIVARLGSITLDGDYPIIDLPRKFVLRGVKILNGAAIDASDTDFAVLTLKSGSTSIATLDTRTGGNGAVVANVGKAFSLVAAYDGTLSAGAPIPASSLKLAYADTETEPEGEDPPVDSVFLTNAVLQLYGFFK